MVFIPARPVQDAIIDPVWGQWVHDILAPGVMAVGIRQNITTNSFGDFTIAMPAGMASVLAASCAHQWNTNGLLICMRNADLGWKLVNGSNASVNGWTGPVDVIIVGLRA